MKTFLIWLYCNTAVPNPASHSKKEKEARLAAELPSPGDRLSPICTHLITALFNKSGGNVHPRKAQHKKPPATTTRFLGHETKMHSSELSLPKQQQSHREAISRQEPLRDDEGDGAGKQGTHLF